LTTRDEKGWCALRLRADRGAREGGPRRREGLTERRPTGRRERLHTSWGGGKSEWAVPLKARPGRGRGSGRGRMRGWGWTGQVEVEVTSVNMERGERGDVRDAARTARRRLAEGQPVGRSVRGGHSARGGASSANPRA
jgi:hypothetical protein